jgi:hypothetical protein
MSDDTTNAGDVIFPIFPPSFEAEPQGDFDKLLFFHEKEADLRKAEFYNFGWYSGGDEQHDDICSKTSRGYLSTRRHRKTGKVEHHWSGYGR